MTYLIRVECDSWCAGVEVRKDFIIRAAPILQWTVGKHYSVLVRWARKKGMKVTWHA